jgi:hypothetical protein
MSLEFFIDIILPAALWTWAWLSLQQKWIDCVWNVMAHAQKPEFVFRRNGRVHLSPRGRLFSRLLEAEVCASAVVMLDTPRSEVVWEYWLPTPFASFPFTSPLVRHRVPSHFNWTLLGIFSGVGSKGGCCVGLTTVPLSCADCHEMWEPQSPRCLRTCSGMYRCCFTVWFFLV